MNGWETLADILRREGVDYLFCFPSNPLIDVAARAGIRPILARYRADRRRHGRRV